MSRPRRSFAPRETPSAAIQPDPAAQPARGDGRRRPTGKAAPPTARVAANFVGVVRDPIGAPQDAGTGAQKLSSRAPSASSASAIAEGEATPTPGSSASAPTPLFGR